MRTRVRNDLDNLGHYGLGQGKNHVTVFRRRDDSGHIKEE
jgi:hypothetical protein